MQDFTDKLAVITGGASGVGRSLAFALSDAGARVLIADIDRRTARPQRVPCLCGPAWRRNSRARGTTTGASRSSTPTASPAKSSFPTV